MVHSNASDILMLVVVFGENSIQIVNFPGIRELAILTRSRMVLIIISPDKLENTCTIA